MKKYVNAWLPVVLWAGLIFWGSHQQDLPQDQVFPFIQWFCQLLGIPPDEAISIGGHFVEYTVLGLLLHRAFNRHGFKKLPAYLSALSAGVLYALSDEFHQSFVPGRIASWFDIGADFLGLAVGLSIYLYLQRTRPSKEDTAERALRM